MGLHLKLKRPLIGHFLYKYFNIETKRYKEYWKEYSYRIQFELEKQPKNLHYSKLLS